MTAGLTLQRPLHGLHAIALDNVADFHVLVVLERHSAFLAGEHLARVVLEALELRELALMDDDTVANKAHAGAALDGIAGAHVDWADSRGLNQWERKALELSEERSRLGYGISSPTV